MTKISKDELLKNEKIEKVLSPHPLSFLKLQSLCIFLIIWGLVVLWLVNFSSYKGFFSGNAWYPVLLWGLVLLLVGVVISLATIQWTIFFLYLGVFIGGVALISWQGWLKDVNVFIPVYSVAVSIAGFLIVELHRRSYKYILSNHRIIFKGGLLTRREKTIRYDKIITFDKKQGVLGQLFGFGTITPITQADAVADSKKAPNIEKEGGKRLRGIFFFSGDKEMRAELKGVYPYKKINKFVEELSQGTELTQYHQEQISYQKQQVDIQKQMRDALKAQTKKVARGKSLVAAGPEDEDEEEPEEEKLVRTKAVISKKSLHPKLKQDDDEEDEEEEEPEEAFQPEQIDIQKQMKELLKKQIEVKDEEEEESDEKKELAEEEEKEESKV
jgi:membrane protein YdbS with pleckstrin-like domain